MFKIGERVVYGQGGVYEIVDVRDEAVLGAVCRYYVLKAWGDKTEALVFVPVDNEALTSSMRYLMSKSDAERFIGRIGEIAPAEWNADNRRRAENLRRAIQDGNHDEIISIIKSIWLKSLDREREGKRGYQTDETMLKKAEHILYTELALALGIDEGEVVEYIRSKVEKDA